MESVSEQAVSYFFALALAQAEYRLAEENVASCDTLYVIGERRFKIAAISRADLLTLELDKVNARNTLENCRIALKRASFSLASFLGMDKNTEIELKMPGRPLTTAIPLDLALAMAKRITLRCLATARPYLRVRGSLTGPRLSLGLTSQSTPRLVSTRWLMIFQAPTARRFARILCQCPSQCRLLTGGVRKGKVNMARNNLNVSRIAARQDELSVEEDIIMTVSDYEVRQRLIASASEALDLAETAYTQTRQRFIIGKADINSITLSLNRRQEAAKNYIAALQNYWLSHYKIRRLTLHDFELDMPLSEKFELKN